MFDRDQETPIVLAGGRVIDPAAGRDETADVLIENGVIAAVGQGIRPDGARIVDVADAWVVPGCIDMHVHLREPGEEYKETVASGTKAAAAGGFTAVACMPNTRPVIDTDQAVRQIYHLAAAAGYARVYPVGAISAASKGEGLAEMGEMRKAGAVAFTDDGLPVEDSQLMRRALEYASTFEAPIISHSEDLALARNGCMNEGELSTRLGLRGIPRVAEEIMVYRDIALAAYTGHHLHLAHISTRESVDLIRRAKERGVPVTAETAPHYFTLTEEAIGSYDTYAKMNPPLRTADDVAAIRAGLADGTLDAIASDHAPHSDMEKLVEFERAANGIIGLETSLPLALGLVHDGTISAARLVELMSVNPARILGVAGGRLAEGATADITVIDPQRVMVYTEEAIVSKSRNSPFLGRELTGRAVLTMVGGRVVFALEG